MNGIVYHYTNILVCKDVYDIVSYIITKNILVGFFSKVKITQWVVSEEILDIFQIHVYIIYNVPFRLSGVISL